MRKKCGFIIVAGLYIFFSDSYAMQNQQNKIAIQVLINNEDCNNDSETLQKTVSKWCNELEKKQDYNKLPSWISRHLHSESAKIVPVFYFENLKKHIFLCPCCGRVYFSRICKSVLASNIRGHMFRTHQIEKDFSKKHFVFELVD